VQTERLDTLLILQPEKMKELRTGAKCLEEVMQNQVQAIDDDERAKRQEIANQKVAKARVRRSETRHHAKKKPLFCASRHCKGLTTTDWRLPRG
jgi:coproporphyrinogen III oxidase-like Fe-S oxidoreductase